MYTHSIPSLLAVAVLVAPLAAQDPPSEETIAYFTSNCQSCHTIGGGRMAGPDLKGLVDRTYGRTEDSFHVLPAKLGADAGWIGAAKLGDESPTRSSADE